MVIGRDEDQDAARLLLRPHAPLHGQIERKLLRGLAFQRRNRNDGNLRFCFLVDLSAQSGQLFLGRCAEDTGEIIHVALWLKILDLLSMSVRNAEYYKNEE